MPGNPPFHERAHFRLRFPLKEQPKLAIHGGDHPVTELSEGGLRFHAQSSLGLVVGDPLAATLTFANGKTDAIEGTICRINFPEYVMQLTKGVSFHEMMDLQRDLQRRYPLHFAVE